MLDKVIQAPTAELQWEHYHMTLYRKIGEIAPVWSALLGNSDIFLSPEYLEALEMAPPNSMSFYYVVVWEGDSPVGIIYLQLHFFNASKSLNYDRVKNENGSSGIRQRVREFVADRIQFHTLVCGNITITGPHGFKFKAGVPMHDRVEIIDASLEWVRYNAEKKGNDVRLMFIKDFFDPVFLDSSGCSFSTTYHEFKAQPGMYLTIPEEWESYGDYLKALQSKYRVRAKRARRMASKLECRELDLQDLLNNNDILYSQYRKIADNAIFNLFTLDQEYFIILKDQLGDKFHVFGYFMGDELVAFYSVVENGDQLVAHFLGYEEKENREMQVYLNMLLDIVQFAIENGFNSIAFARTALEIKSSVGATPRNLRFYLRFNNGFHNKLLPFYYNLLEPEEEWVERSPFKQDT